MLTQVYDYRKDKTLPEEGKQVYLTLPDTEETLLLLNIIEHYYENPLNENTFTETENFAIELAGKLKQTLI